MPHKNHSMLILLLAMLAATTLVNCKRRSRDRCGHLVKVMVASDKLEPGTPLSGAVVEEREFPEELYTDSILTMGDLVVNQRRLLVHRIEKGQPIYFHNFEDEAYEKSLSQKLRPGSRVYSVEVNEAGGCGYWIRDNDHVDVLVTVPRRTDGQSEQVTFTLLQNVVVLKAGPKGQNVINPDDEDMTFRSVTLLVLPEEADLLHQAESTGRLKLSLRNPDDRTLLDVDSGPRMTTQDSLFSRQRPPRNKLSEPQPPTSPLPAPPPPPPASTPASR
jgi:pilus assembly protein CpaB